MEIWLDTTDLKTIQHAHSLEILYGVTTNPILLAEANQEPHHLFQQILDKQIGPLAVQIAETDKEDMLRQAKELYRFSSRIIVKIPACRDGYFVIEELSEEGIPVMATTIFEAHQAYLAMKLRACYIAPYLGRIADGGKDPKALLELIQKMKQDYGFESKVLAAGIRSLDFFNMAIETGCSAITLPKKVYNEFISAPPGAEKALEDFKRVELLAL